MLSQVYLLIQPKTPESRKKRKTGYLPKGTLKQIVIRFLSGCGESTHIEIAHNGKVIYPTSPDDVLDVKEVVMLHPDSYKLEDETNLFTLEGYNEHSKEPSRIKVDFAVWADREVVG